MTGTPLTLHNVSKTWSTGKIVLQHISFQATPGTVTAILGPSGAGKTTLLRLISGLVVADGGRVSGISEQPVLVFQEDSLWPHLTLLENVSLPGRVLLGWEHSVAEQRATHLLEEWGLKDKLRCYPGELSGGQKQRGALARALIKRPKIMCLDEITSGLDPETSAGILRSIISLKLTETIVIMATHQLAFALATADRVVFLDNGRVVDEGVTRKVLVDPANARVRAFVSAYNFSANVLTALPQ